MSDADFEGQDWKEWAAGRKAHFVQVRHGQAEMQRWFTSAITWYKWAETSRGGERETERARQGLYRKGGGFALSPCASHPERLPPSWRLCLRCGTVQYGAVRRAAVLV